MIKKTDYEKWVIGLMSGTSADGIDTALVKIRGCGLDSVITLEAFECFPYTPEQRELILAIAGAEEYKVNDLVRADIYLGELFSDAVNTLLHKVSLRNSDIDLIGSHGQTVRHLPAKIKMLGKDISATWQIGDPSVIAQKTGITTVGDFRRADMAAGGQGAPLVPLFDYVYFRSQTVSRILLNIGGIANVTILPAKISLDNVIAFDTGPGNAIVDNLCKTYFGTEYDQNGAISACGKVDYAIVDILLKDKYFTTPPPKSTGREVFNVDYLLKNKYLSGVDKVAPQNLVATMTYFTAKTIAVNIELFSVEKIDEIVASGGGVNNLTLMTCLRNLLPGINIITTNDLGLPADAREAVCFAFLANETMHRQPGNVPRATGASRPVSLGKICYP